VAQLFTGTFRRSLDTKNRFLVPSEVRDALAPDDRGGLFLIPGRKCILVWPRSFLDTYTEQQQQGGDPLSKLSFNRSFYSQMIFRSFDTTGRIVLPGELADRFPEREAVLVGAGRYLELWAPGALAENVEPLDF
jgi:MraZ protein